MNTLTGKSVGIALLMAAALIAALFAMGVFAPAGLDARVATGDDAPTVKLLDDDDAELTLDSSPRTGGTIVVEFQVDDTVDGMFEGDELSDDVTITIPSSLVTNGATVGALAVGITDTTVRIMQGTAHVGSGTVTGADATGVTITITKVAAGSSRTSLVKDETTTVTIPGVTFAGTAATLGDNPDTTEVEDDFVTAQGTPFGGTVIVKQSPFTTEHKVMAAVFTPDKTFTNAEVERAIIGGQFGLRVKFTARMEGSATNANTLTITLPKVITAASAPTVTEESTGTGTITADGAASDADTPVVITVSEYPEGVATVLISGLSGPEDWDGLEVLFKEGTHFERAAMIGGPAVQGPDAPDAVDPDADDTDTVLDTNKADAATKVQLTGLMARSAIRGGRDIVITLPKFQLPDSIDESQIIVDEADDGNDANNDTTTDFYGNPETVSVSGSTITITLPTSITIGTGIERNDVDDEYSILIKKSAGIKNPNSDGMQTIKVEDLDSTDHEFDVTIVSHAAADPGWVIRGGEVEITAKGVNAKGDVTAHLYSGSMDVADLDNLDLVRAPVVGRAAMSDGTAVITVNTKPSIFLRGAVDATEDPAADAKGVNKIVLVDAAGTVIGKTQAHTRIGILPSVELDVSEVRRSGKVEVSVSDWYYGTHISLVKINGITVNLPDNTNKPNDDDDLPDMWDITRDGVDYRHTEAIESNGKATFDVIVDRDTRLGEMQVELHGANIVNDIVIASLLEQGSATSPDIHKQTVQVGFFPLTITPSNEDGDGLAVTEQVIQIEGEEFLARACITSIRVGERDIMEATNGDTVLAEARDDCVDTDSNGKLTATFRVPRGLNPGEYTVVVRDEGNRVGQGTLIVPKPMITLDPERSQRGTTVTVVGKNFPADDVVTIDYRGVTVEATSTDTVGNFRATFQVPITAPIGATHEVIAASENKADGLPDAPQNQPEVTLTAMAEHRVSDEILMLSPGQVAPGQQLTINASNLPLFTPVTISIGGRNVAGKALGQDDASDGFGQYIDDVLVPQLPPGVTIVELTVHTERGDDVRVAEFVEITNIVTRPTDEVFADLMDAGQLTVVWRYDNATASWASFDPVAPAELNDLNLVSTGDIVWVEVTESVEFQGDTLFTGWNLINLE